MPTLDKHHSSKIVKMLLMGNQGAGKTGAYAMLAAAGYRVIVADFDNGLDTAANFLPDAAKPNLHYKVFRNDKTGINGGKLLIKGLATDFTGFRASMDRWVDKDESGKIIEDLGAIESWDEKTVFVIDSLTNMSKAAGRYANQSLNQPMDESSWDVYFAAQNYIQEVLETITSPRVKCNIVVTAHVRVEEDDTTKIKEAYPITYGKALNPIVGTYFNVVLEAVQANMGKRIVRTQTRGLVKIKIPLPPSVQTKPEYPIEVAIPELFRLLKGEVKPVAPATS